MKDAVVSRRFADLLPVTQALPWLAALLLLAAAAAPPAWSAPAGENDPAELTPLGDFVHDAGELVLATTNYGLIGAHPAVDQPLSDQPPSGRWPGADGPGHLFSAGLWVGAELIGQKLVSTGQYEMEFRPGEDPADTIYEMAEGAPGARRYPDPAADDDGDGLEDEDPFNGRDDDMDGLIDEDGAGMSDQMFRCEYRDNTAEAVSIYADHQPLDLAVVARSLQWAAEDADDFVGFDFTVTNIGVATLENVYVGFFADFDIRADAPGGPGGMDDLAGNYRGMVGGNDGSYYPVEIGYARDGGGLPGAGHIGIMPLDHPRDPSGATAPETVGIRSNQILTGQMPFDQGGDPTNDAERYELLSADQWDADAFSPDDYRILISVGPFASLAPGESMDFRFAMVAGADKPAMLRNATEAIRAWEGRRFDRDGDPQTGPDGCEYAVHWLWEQAVVVAVEGGKLTAAPVDRGVDIAVDVPDKGPADLFVERRGPAGDRRLWSLEPLAAAGSSDLRIEFRDEDDAGWPRIYRLLRMAAGEEIELDSVQVNGPPSAAMSLSVFPNPCNPGTVVEFGLPQSCRAALTVHDMAGRLVARLAEGEFPEGMNRVEWKGHDLSGRSVAAGTYLLRVDTPYRIETRKLTVVK